MVWLFFLKHQILFFDPLHLVIASNFQQLLAASWRISIFFPSNWWFPEGQLMVLDVSGSGFSNTFYRHPATTH